MADRIVVMNQGHIEQVGTPREIYETPATPFAADFIGKINVLPAVAEGAGRFRVGQLSLEIGARRHCPRARRRSSTCARRTSPCTPTARRRRTATRSAPRSRRSSSWARSAWSASPLGCGRRTAAHRERAAAGGRRRRLRARRRGRPHRGAGRAARARLTSRADRWHHAPPRCRRRRPAAVRPMHALAGSPRAGPARRLLRGARAVPAGTARS